MRLLVVGIGNPLKTDDNIGNIISQELSKEYDTLTAETTPETYFGKMKEFDVIIFVDAVDFNTEPGEVKLFSMEQVKDKKFSTHSIPLDLIKHFFPEKKIFIIGIMPESVDYGSGLTKGIKNKKSKIIREVKQLLNKILS